MQGEGAAGTGHVCDHGGPGAGAADIDGEHGPVADGGGLPGDGPQAGLLRVGRRLLPCHPLRAVGSRQVCSAMGPLL